MRGEGVEAFHNNWDNVYSQHIDRWTPNNPDAGYPRLTIGTESVNNSAELHLLAGERRLCKAEECAARLYAACQSHQQGKDPEGKGVHHRAEPVHRYQA